MSPLLGVCGETGDVLALRARGGNANAGRATGSFIDECVAAIPPGARGDYQLWVRVDSAGYQADVVEAAERHDAAFTITTKLDAFRGRPAGSTMCQRRSLDAWRAQRGRTTIPWCTQPSVPAHRRARLDGPR